MAVRSTTTAFQIGGHSSERVPLVDTGVASISPQSASCFASSPELLRGLNYNWNEISIPWPSRQKQGT